MKLIHFTDSHVQTTMPQAQQFCVQPFWPGDPRVLFERLGELTRDADGILFSGDAGHSGLRENVELFFELLAIASHGKPVFMVLGNHDVADGRGDVPQVVRRYPNVRFGDGIYPLGDLDVVLINNGYLTAEGEFSESWPSQLFPVPALSAEQIEQLDRELARDANRAAIAVIHCPAHVIPPVPKVNGMRLHEGMQQYRMQLHGLLDKHPRVRRVLCGHVHFAGTQTSGRGRVHQCLGSFIEFPYQVRILRITGPHVQSSIVQLAGDDDTEGSGTIVP